jgi:hypothetical protein
LFASCFVSLACCDVRPKMSHQYVLYHRLRYERTRLYVVHSSVAVLHHASARSRRRNRQYVRGHFQLPFWSVIAQSIMPRAWFVVTPAVKPRHIWRPLRIFSAQPDRREPCIRPVPSSPPIPLSPLSLLIWVAPCMCVSARLGVSSCAHGL